tara:strand:- start:319 stop:582 length:264 start_codon:yes stop_codon:yes gene_type:complete
MNGSREFGKGPTIPAMIRVTVKMELALVVLKGCVETIIHPTNAQIRVIFIMEMEQVVFQMHLVLVRILMAKVNHFQSTHSVHVVLLL